VPPWRGLAAEAPGCFVIKVPSGDNKSIVRHSRAPDKKRQTASPWGSLWCASRAADNAYMTQPAPSAGAAPGASRRTVAARTALYLLAGSVQKAAYLLLLPFLVAALSPDEYTRFGLMTSAMVILCPLLSLNVHLAPSRLYFDYERSGRPADLLATCAAAALGLSLCGVAVLVVVLRLSGLRDPLTRGQAALQVAVAAIVVLRVAMEFGLTYLRVRGRAGRFGLTAGLQGFVLLGAFVTLGGLVGGGVLRAALALALAYAAAAAVAAIWTAPALRGGLPHAAVLSRAVAFSWPTGVHAVALWGIAESGRWIGVLYLKLPELAPYTLVTQVAAAMMMIGRAMFEARLPDIGRAFAAGQPRRGAAVIRRTTLAALALVVAAYAAAYVAVFHLGLPLPAGYRPTPLLLLIAAAANVCDVLYLRGVQTLMALKRTGTQAAMTAAAAVAAVAASFVLVRVLRDVGLAAATAVGLLIQAVASNAAARAHLRREKSSTD